MSIYVVFGLQEGSFDLVLPWSVHVSTALCLVQALARHLPFFPGGRDYFQGTVGKVRETILLI